MNRPEQKLQKAVFEHIRVRAVPGVVAWHTPNGGWRSRTEAKILKGQGVRPGIPDICAVKDGRAYFLELKAEGGRLTDPQEQTLIDLRAAGAQATHAHGLDQALAVLEQWGILRGKAA